MKTVTLEEYTLFLRTHDVVPIASTTVNLVKTWRIETFQPESYTPEEWTVWSFPDRGSWATHMGNYRGNWSPYIPRNLIHRYTRPGDAVCDPMVGSGTTLVECKLMARNGIGVDVNPDAAMVTMNRLDFDYDATSGRFENLTTNVFVGDARKLDLIADESVDLIATHPPYASIIPYSGERIHGDLSSLKFVDFFEAIGKVAVECVRILKPGKHCAILIGDTRKHRHYVPIHIGVLNKFLEAGFVLKEDIIKLQHKTKSARERWGGHTCDFYKIAHEHLYVFRKLEKGESISDYKNSIRWW